MAKHVPFRSLVFDLSSTRLVVLAIQMIVWMGGTAHASDRITVRGNYYRENSTRAVQPLVLFQKDLAEHKVTLSAEYALDAISSASIAAGSAALGGDVVFNESRHETAVGVLLAIPAITVSANYRYSTETDYESHQANLALSREVFSRRGTIMASYSLGLNRTYQILNNLGVRKPWTSNRDTNLLQVHYAVFSYSHIVSPRALVGATLDLGFLRGPQENPYRRVRNGLPEHHPWARNRVAVSANARWSPKIAGPLRIVLDGEYRYYQDDWKLSAHALDARLHFRPHRHLRLRARYRYYTQTDAFFWRNAQALDIGEPYLTADPKMAAFHSHTPGIQATWELDGLARHRGLDWLANGWIQATYNHVFQTSSFPNARLGSLAFSLAF